MSEQPDPTPETPAETPETPAEPPPERERYKSRIMIRPNGEVVIENLSMDLMALAEALDPDSAIACEIGELLGRPPEAE